jgi:protein-disulfide isomerase
MRFVCALLLVGLSGGRGALAQTNPGAPTGKSALNKAALEAYLRHLELFRGTVNYQIDDPKPSKSLPGFSEMAVHLTFEGGSKDELYYVSADGQTIVQGDIYNISRNPFQKNLDRLTTTDRPSFGPAEAPVMIVEFGDLECPDCKMEAPILRHNVTETFGNKVRVYFQDFPLESIHPWARAAAIAGRCVYQQDHEAFWKFYDWIYNTQDEITAESLNSKVLGWAGQNNVDTIQIGRCLDTKATEPEIDRSIAEGRALDVRGTPTLFINGRKIGGLQWPDLQLVINNELQYQANR